MLKIRLRVEASEKTRSILNKLYHQMTALFSEKGIAQDLPFKESMAGELKFSGPGFDDWLERIGALIINIMKTIVALGEFFETPALVDISYKTIIDGATKDTGGSADMGSREMKFNLDGFDDWIECVGLNYLYDKKLGLTKIKKNALNINVQGKLINVDLHQQGYALTMQLDDDRYYHLIIDRDTLESVICHEISRDREWPHERSNEHDHGYER